MGDSHTLWLDLRTVLCSVLFYHLLLKRPLGEWLQRGYLRQDGMAPMQRTLYEVMVKLWLISPISLPNIDVEKLVGKPLPNGFATRLWKSDDFEACLEIYRLNAPDRFPAEVEQEFEAILKRGDNSMVVIENKERIVACGGASLSDAAGGMLFYGLIHPEFQQQGLGRLLLLSRLARFHGPAVIVQICAVEGSVGYYERFGFSRFAQWSSQNGETHPIAGVSLHPETCQKIATFLAAEGYPVLPALSA
jgi:ribosomal-protein-alanine N-acetyltransferase